MEFSSLRIETTHIFGNLFDLALLPEFVVALFLLEFESKRRADHFERVCFPGNALSLHTSEASTALDGGTSIIFVHASSVETGEARLTSDIETLSNIRGKVSFGFSFELAEVTGHLLLKLLKGGKLGEEGHGEEEDKENDDNGLLHIRK